jgi:predicted nucleic acid-binding Zn ribbon protein
MSFQSLPQLLNSISNQESWRGRRQFQALIASWPELVGAAVAAQTQPISIQRRVLQVAAANSAWAQNLAFERQHILEKLNARLELDLTDIRFSTASWRYEAPILSGQISGELGVENFSEAAILWRDHPSRLPYRGRRSIPKLARDPQTAFRDWARAMRIQSQHLPLCPSCGCPCPDGELKRWAVCSLCAAKQFGTTNSWGYARESLAQPAEAQASVAQASTTDLPKSPPKPLTPL